MTPTPLLGGVPVPDPARMNDLYTLPPAEVPPANPAELRGIMPVLPLTAAYCAERSALALAASERLPSDLAGALLAAAEGWLKLAAAMGTNPALSRPHDEEPGRGRR